MSRIRFTCAVGALALMMGAPALAGDLELYDEKTGVAATLPENWNFALEGDRFVAASEDRRAMLIMVATEDGFERQALAIEILLKAFVFRDVEVEQATILVATERGALEGAVVARGRAVHRKDGAPVEFEALLVKSGDTGELIFGAWKDTVMAEQVRGILQSVHVRQKNLEGGLKLADEATGAKVTLPESWTVYAYRHGLMAVSPQRDAMTLFVGARENFWMTRMRVRATLTEMIFKDVEIGQWLAVESKTTYRGFDEMITAQGTARDRIDDAKVEFTATIAQSKEMDRGIIIVGAWKNPDQKDTVIRTLKSLEPPDMSKD